MCDPDTIKFARNCCSYPLFWFWIIPSVYACQTEKNAVLNFFRKAILQCGLQCEMWLYMLFLVLENKGGKTNRELLQQAIVYQFAAGGCFWLFFLVFFFFFFLMLIWPFPSKMILYKGSKYPWDCSLESQHDSYRDACHTVADKKKLSKTSV